MTEDSLSHLSPEAIRGWQERTLSASGILAAGDHLAGCPECRKLVAEAQAEAFEFSPHLSFEDLEAFARGGVDPRRDLHLTTCAMCAAEAADLRSFHLEAAQRGDSRTRLNRLAIPVVVVLAAAAAIFLVVQPPAKVPVLASIVSPVILYDGGAAWTRDAAGGIAGFQTADAEELRAVKSALDSGRLPPASGMADLRRGTETLLSGGTAARPVLVPVAPVGVVVPDAAPEFRWTPMSEASEYRVAVYDRDFERVADSGSLTGTAWHPPNRLVAGRTYSWTVTALVKGRLVTAPRAPQPDARFRIATELEAGELESLRRRVPKSDLMTAIRASELGMADEAGKALDELARVNPGSEIVVRLRESLAAKVLNQDKR